jgi:Ca-activated chloride channel family protein
MALLRNHIQSRLCKWLFSQSSQAVKGLLPLVVLFAFSSASLAQTNQLLQQGNQLYSKQRYDEAANNYMKALQKDPNNVTGLFNLGNALYQKQKYDTSRKIMAATANALKDKGGKAAVNYNIGNTYMAQRNWDEAINAYKNTLRNNPQDVDAKYNLSYAGQMKKQEDKKGGKKDKKDQKDKKEQQKDKQKQDKDNKDKDKQDQQNQDDKKQQDNKDQKPQSQPSKLSKQQADQMLNALQQEEKKLQDKLKKEKAIPLKLDKDW